jgi:hypothetical protein
MDINDKIEKILKNFSKPIKKSIRSSTTTNENIGKISASDDKSFEDNVRRVLKEYFNLKEHNNEMISSNKEFVFYKMDLFNYDDKELITSEYFDKDLPYFCIIRKVDKAKTNEILKEGETKKDFEEYFIINNNDLSTLYYKNKLNNMEDTARGIEESNYTSGDATKFFFIQDDEKNSKDINEIFIDTIKFNLLSSQTISLIGENNKIPEDILKNYYAKGQLFSKGKIPHMLSFVKYNECSGIEGKFHYPMKPYYIKLTSMKGQIDAAFISNSEINLVDFNCTKIYNNFETIPENSTILFEFKNGKSGERKVITQAFKYQMNAEYILKNKTFYHIIIINTKELGNALEKYIKENIDQIKKLINFAVLCLYSSNKICGKELESNTKNILNQKTKFQNKSKKKPNKDSKVSTDIETRMSNMEAKMDNMEKRMDNMEAKMDNMEKRMSNMEAKIDNMEKRMEKRMDKMESDIVSIKTMLLDLGKTIKEIQNNSKASNNNNI